MMENYYGFFTQHPVLLQHHKQFNEDIHRHLSAMDHTSGPTVPDEETLQFIQEAMSKEVPSGVVVTIAENQNAGPRITPPPDVYDDLTFEPEEGVLVATDKPSLPGRENIQARISMVQAFTNYDGLDSQRLQNLADEQKKARFSLADTLNYAGVFQAGVTRSVVNGVVEVGDFTGNLNTRGLAVEDPLIYDFSKSLIGKHKDNSQVNLSVTTASGNSIEVTVSIKEAFNTKTAEGAQRNLNVSFQASSELTDEEATALNSLVQSLDPLIYGFNKNKYVTDSLVDSYAARIGDLSDIFSDVDTQFTYRGYITEKTISLTSEQSGLKVATDEKNMSLYYQTEYFVANNTAIAFGKSSEVGFDYFESLFDR
ncbi:hypothetical protein BGP77_17620 [Saccharospirillum sp. MSK14-1]|uniref:hypothetical protein n=1 Tax=Saccharospirillum sp. MSK14-1 TaxID=1897632 RepID=UPI000D3BCC5F|nr:hypothetical protein [Saccharospirillum sp. MSK14-1]PTY38258.1 hypothetical protein BGP77_17620 [Saccharospirillum sp. MSK14-1]